MTPNQALFDETSFSNTSGFNSSQKPLTVSQAASNPLYMKASNLANYKIPMKPLVGNPDEVVPGKGQFSTPQLTRKTYSEQLSQVKTDNLRQNHLVVMMSDDDQLRTEPQVSQPGAISTAGFHHQRRYSVAATPMDVGYRDNDYSYYTQTSPGFFGGVFNCLRPVFKMVGRKSTSSLQPKNGTFGTIDFNTISGMTFVTSGAQGAVYKGVLDGRYVAVKRLRTRIEIDIIKSNLMAIKHPNIVQILGVSLSPYAIIMEFCAGGPLYRLLRDPSAVVTPILIIEWARQIASAMQYLHQRKIVHRDLKSPNCLIGEQNQIKLIDFGNCKQLSRDSSHEHMSFSGTFAWMAPEVIRNENCNEKVDVWSYGVVLWELITRQVPYANVDSSAIIWGVGSNKLSLPIPNTCPAPLRMLLNLCWRQNFKERPSFAQILLHIDIWAVDFVQTPYETLVDKQATWRDELRDAFERINKEGGGILELQRMDNEIVNQHRNELRHAQDVRSCYEEKLSRANVLMTELQTVLVDLEHREKLLRKKEREVENILKMKKTTKSSIAQLDMLIQMQTQGSQKDKTSTGSLYPAELNSPALSDFHRRRCQTLNNNVNTKQEPIPESDAVLDNHRSRLFPKMSASTLFNLNLTPTRTRARRSLRINMFKKEQQRVNLSSTYKQEKTSRRTKSLDPSSPLVNQNLNNQPHFNQSQTANPLMSSHHVVNHQKSSSLIGSAKQQITRKASNVALAASSDQSNAWSNSEADGSQCGATQRVCRSTQRNHCKDQALAKWSNTVRNAFLSASLDRAKFTNLKENMDENKLRRISRSLSNLQQELDDEINASKQRQTETLENSVNALSDKSTEFLSTKTGSIHYKNNLFKDAQAKEKDESDCYSQNSLSKRTFPSHASCCRCKCHSESFHKRNHSNISYNEKLHKNLSPTSSYSATTFSKLKDSDQISLTDSPRFSSEEDMLEDCASDDLAEREDVVKQFLQKITNELTSTTNLSQKSTEYLY